MVAAFHSSAVSQDGSDRRGHRWRRCSPRGSGWLGCLGIAMSAMSPEPGYPCFHFAVSEVGTADALGLANLLETLAGQIRNDEYESILDVTISSEIRDGAQWWTATVYFGD